MKDSEFIELLNLYLDHEISTADAARLEAEVQANPALPGSGEPTACCHSTKSAMSTSRSRSMSPNEVLLI